MFRFLCQRPLPSYATLLLQPLHQRWMGGGPRSREQITRMRALRRERKEAYKHLPPPPPKPPKVINTEQYDNLMQWKEKPIKDAIVPDVPPIEEFIKTMWLTAYPMGSNLRKLQRDVAFRMKTRKFRKKLDYQELMPIVGKLEREGFLKTKISTSGKCLIYRDKDCINVENPFIIRYSETSESSAPIEPQPIADEVLVGPTNA